MDPSMLAQQHMMQMGREHMGMNVHPAMGHVQVRVGIGTALSLYLVLTVLVKSMGGNITNITQTGSQTYDKLLEVPVKSMMC